MTGIQPPGTIPPRLDALGRSDPSTWRGGEELSLRKGGPGGMLLGACLAACLAGLLASSSLWADDTGSGANDLTVGRFDGAAAEELSADGGGESHDETQARVGELESIRSEIGRLQKRLTSVRVKESDLEGRLEAVKLELELQEAQVSEATAASELATVRAETAQRQVTTLETALQQVRQDLGRRLVGLYRLGGQGYMRLFLTLQPNENLLPAIRQLRFLVRQDQIALDSYVSTLEKLSFQRRRLETERREAAEWQLREAQRRDALVEVRRRHEQTIAAVAAERKRLAARTLQLKDKERKLARLIGSLVSRDEALAGTPIQDFRGVLDWPSRGEVKLRFGPRRDPRYRTEVPHNGIDIEVEEGSRVRVVFPGQVLYAAPFEGYGTMVVVHHPGRVFTLYAGLLEIHVDKGDVLSLGDVVGNSADVIYFEVRVENEPRDPLLWLR